MLKRQSLIGFSILCIFAVFTSIGSVANAEPIVIRFSHVVGENTPKGIGAKMFQELVEQRLSGRVLVVVYPNSQKFTDEQALLGLLFGDIQIAAPSFTKFRKFSRALQVFDLPFLFESVEEVHRFQASEAGQKLLSSMADRGILGLRYWDNGMRIMSAKKPITKPADLKGLTFRIEPSYVFQQQYATLGAIATPMPFKHLADALRVGIVDGHENAWSNVLSGRLHLLRPNFTEVGHSYLGYMVVTSKEFWEKLPADIRAELNNILDEVTVEVNRLALEKEQADKSIIMKSSKVKVITLSEEEKQAWKEALVPLWQEFEASIGADIMAAAKESKMAQ